jgi:hypothetical protein
MFVAAAGMCCRGCTYWALLLAGVAVADIGSLRRCLCRRKVRHMTPNNRRLSVACQRQRCVCTKQQQVLALLCILLLTVPPCTAVAGW